MTNTRNKKSNSGISLGLSIRNVNVKSNADFLTDISVGFIWCTAQYSYDPNTKTFKEIAFPQRITLQIFCASSCAVIIRYCSIS